MDVEGKRAREGWSGRWCEGRKKEERQENRGGEFRQGRRRSIRPRKHHHVNLVMSLVSAPTYYI